MVKWFGDLVHTQVFSIILRCQGIYMEIKLTLDVLSGLGRQQPKKRVLIRQVLYDKLDLTWGYTTFVGRVPKRIYLLGMKTNANKLAVCYNVIFIVVLFVII